jgi:protein-S-isoprenylcysteine O-methyltransferase Ste14
MQELTKKAITGLIWLQIIMAVMLFVPALTLYLWEAWAFWLLFSVLSAVVTFYFLKHDPGPVESRLKVGPTAEHEKSQKVIQTLTAILWCALIIVPGIERRFHFSRIPAALVLLGDALVAVGYYIVFLALRENRWAASIIEVRPGQSVISTGPYRIVRRPMYSGGALMILSTPLALGSLWAFVCAILLCGIIAARLLDEERYLSKNLPDKAGLPHQGWLPRLTSWVSHSIILGFSH